MSIVLPSLIGANKPASGTPFTNQYSVSFDGTDDYMDCGTVSAVNNASSITWSGWFKFSALNTLFLTGGINSSNRFSFYLKSGGVIRSLFRPFRAFN